MRICFPLHRNKNVIFANLRKICIDIPQLPPRKLPIPDPGPYAHLESLATILELTASLPAQLPMRSELQGVASKALDAAVADLGEGVELQKDHVTATGAHA
jgi:hypothetical protein